MAIRKFLLETSSTLKKIEKLNNFLSENEIEIHLSHNNGLLYRVGNKYYKFLIENDSSDFIPSGFEGKYIECDQNGNIDYYQKDLENG